MFSLAEATHIAETAENKVAKNVIPEQHQCFGGKSTRDTCFFCKKKITANLGVERTISVASSIWLLRVEGINIRPERKKGLVQVNFPLTTPQKHRLARSSQIEPAFQWDLALWKKICFSVIESCNYLAVLCFHGIISCLAALLNPRTHARTHIGVHSEDTCSF